MLLWGGGGGFVVVLSTHIMTMSALSPHPSVCQEQMLPVLKALTEDDDPDVRYFSDEALSLVADCQ